LLHARPAARPVLSTPTPPPPPAPLFPYTTLFRSEGGINDEFPFLLGHEAAGVVEAVGDDVTGVAPGDFVILNWRAVCGRCRACRSEDHTSELQSRFDLVCRLLLEHK